MLWNYPRSCYKRFYDNFILDDLINHLFYKSKNKVVDDFIRHTHISNYLEGTV